MVSYYQVYYDRNGKRYGPYWILSIYLRSNSGHKIYKKVHLGKNLVKGLVNHNHTKELAEESKKVKEIITNNPNMDEKRIASLLMGSEN